MEVIPILIKILLLSLIDRKKTNKVATTDTTFDGGGGGSRFPQRDLQQLISGSSSNVEYDRGSSSSKNKHRSRDTNDDNDDDDESGEERKFSEFAIGTLNRHQHHQPPSPPLPRDQRLIPAGVMMAGNRDGYRKKVPPPAIVPLTEDEIDDERIFYDIVDSKHLISRLGASSPLGRSGGLLMGLSLHGAAMSPETTTTSGPAKGQEMRRRWQR